MSYRSPSEFDARTDDNWSLSVPATPASINIKVGVRWVKVTWQASTDNHEAPAADFLLAVSPGKQTIRFDAGTTETVLIALAPDQVYSVFVAARNASGSSGWISSRPFTLSYDEAAPPQGHALLDAQLFEDLLLLNDDALRLWLDPAHDIDLKLALSSLTPPLQERVLACIEPAERSMALRRAVLPTPLLRSLPAVSTSTAIARPEDLRPIQTRAESSKAIMLRPEIVIQVPTPRRRFSRGWMALPLALLILMLVGLGWRLWPTGDTTPEATVAGVQVAASTAQPAVAVEATATSSATATTTPSATATATTTPQPTVTPLVYAEPSVNLINVRTGPSEAYPVLGLIPAGSNVMLSGRSEDGSWVYVSSGAVEGWAASWLFSLRADPTQLAILAAPPLPTPTQTSTPTAEDDAIQIVAVSMVQTKPVTPTATITPTAKAEVLSTTAPTPLFNAFATALFNAFATALPPRDVSNSSICLTDKEIRLIHPVEKGVHDQVTFRWGFDGQLPAKCGFEVRVWREGETPEGVHDAVLDNKTRAVKRVGGDEFELNVPFLHNLPSISGAGTYWWTVAIVEIEPAYRDIGQQAAPSFFYVNTP